MSMLFRLWSYLKSTFSKPVNDYGSGEPFIPTWGIIVPHTQASQGASSWDSIYTEYLYGLALVNLLPVPWGTRNNKGVYGAAKTLKERGCTCSLEPHFNAYNKRAHGAEILVMKGDDLSAKYARLIMDDFSEEFPTKRLRHDKGIKWVSRGDRGYNNLLKAKLAGMKVALLSELHFGDNERDFISPTVQAEFLKEHICGVDIEGVRQDGETL